MTKGLNKPKKPKKAASSISRAMVAAPPVAAPPVAAPAVAAPVADAEAVSVPAPATPSDRNALYVLMLSLLYPAVLGTIFYTFLQLIFQGSWLTDRLETRKILYAFGVVCHYHIDFLYVYSFEVYKRLAFFVDLTIVILLYCAFAALTGTPTPDYRTFFLCFLLIYLTFLPHELIILWRYKIAKDVLLIKVHVRMLIHEGLACAFFVACLLWPRLAASEYGAVLLLLVSFDYALVLRARTKHRKII